jgi:hypothetical protein
MYWYATLRRGHLLALQTSARGHSRRLNDAYNKSDIANGEHERTGRSLTIKTTPAASVKVVATPASRAVMGLPAIAA